MQNLRFPRFNIANIGLYPFCVVIGVQVAFPAVAQQRHNALGLENWLAGQDTHITRFDASLLAQWLPPRRPTSHKGDHGRLLIIGGDHGTAGAIRMTGEAALRSGAGLVRVLTRSENIPPIITARPELMVHELAPQAIEEGLEWADVVVIGPGLGQQEWGKRALQKAENFRKPMLWDADALNLLAINPDTRHNRILTPHPGEAARLLNCSVAEIESDRLLSAQRLVKRYGGVVVLKGAGTVIASDDAMGIVDAGNAGWRAAAWVMCSLASLAHCSDRNFPFMMQPVLAAWPTVRRLTGWLLVTDRAVCWPPIFFARCGVLLTRM